MCVCVCVPRKQISTDTDLMTIVWDPNPLKNAFYCSFCVPTDGEEVLLCVHSVCTCVRVCVCSPVCVLNFYARLFFTTAQR